MNITDNTRQSYQLEYENTQLNYNADPNIRDNNGETPLFRAFMKNNIDKIELLLQYGADSYIKNNNGINIFNFDSFLQCSNN